MRSLYLSGFGASINGYCLTEFSHPSGPAIFLAYAQLVIFLIWSMVKTPYKGTAWDYVGSLFKVC